jgi:hypothetical protein
MQRWIDRRRAARKRPASGPRPAVSRERVPGPAEIENVLECACKDATPAVVLVRDTRDVLRGRFACREGSRVSLVLDGQEDGAAPRPLSLCCVSFALDERAYVFLAPLWRISPNPGKAPGRLLSVGLPGQMAALDVGSARRIPIGVTLPIEIGTYDRRAWTPEAVDLSATGVLLEFGAEKPPRLPVGALVEITLELEDVRATLTAAVRRRDGSRLALSFVDLIPGPTATPPQELQEILARLEHLWLESSGD